MQFKSEVIPLTLKKHEVYINLNEILNYYNSDSSFSCRSSFGLTFTGFTSIKAQNMTAPVNMTSGSNSLTNTLQLSVSEKKGVYTWVNENGTNPNLNFKQNMENVVQITNPTDSKHQLVITAEGKEVASSGDILPGKSGELTFARLSQGETLEYHCLYHPSTMKGTITISS